MSQLFLSTPDRAAIVAQLIDLFQGSARERRVLVEMAGVGEITSALDLSGEIQTAVGSLVLTLEKYGPLPEEPLQKRECRRSGRNCLWRSFSSTSPTPAPSII